MSFETQETEGVAVVNDFQQGWPYFLSVLVNGATDYVQIF